MRFWKRSICQDGHSRRDFTKPRSTSRKRRFQLENLEERALLSTYTLFEYFDNNQTPVLEEIITGQQTNFYINPSGPVDISTGSGTNTVNILDTKAFIGINLHSGGTDTVNVGNAGSVQGILADVNIENPPHFSTITVDDSADGTGRTVTLSTFTPPGDTAWGQIAGLAPAAINYEYADTSSVHIKTGSAADTVNVQGTGVTTYLDSSGGLDTVNVGKAGSVQGILGELYIENSPSFTSLSVDDRADTTAHTVTLSTFTPVADTAWGQIAGLAPATINYEYADTSSVHFWTGTAADTVNIQGTGVTTGVYSGGGADTVNVGNAGSVQGILGDLLIETLADHTTLNVDDSADTTARTVTLSSFTPQHDTAWGKIAGLAPATINYEYFNISSVHIITGSAADTVNVQATGVTTYLDSGGGADTVNVGNAGSVQGILGTLNIENSPSFTTLNVDDSADATAHTVTLSSFKLPGDTPWGRIAGLAHAAINYEYADTSSVSIMTGTAADTVNVQGTGVTTFLDSSGGLDTVNVGKAGSVQGILGTLNIENSPLFTTLNINDSADATARTASLSSFTATFDSNSLWGSITGLAPASINFEWDDVQSPVNISTSPGKVAWIVNNNALANVVGKVVEDNGIQIN
jgi:hypothetical protein